MPEKAARKRLEADSGELFDYQLADRLHMTVADVRRMSHEEWVTWNAYIRREQQYQEMERQARQARGGR